MVSHPISCHAKPTSSPGTAVCGVFRRGRTGVENNEGGFREFRGCGLHLLWWFRWWPQSIWHFVGFWFWVSSLVGIYFDQGVSVDCLGHVCLISHQVVWIQQACLKQLASYIEEVPLWWVSIFPKSSWPHIQPRLYIHLLLSCKESSFATVWATVCSSWVRINCYTSCRSVLLPEGDTGKRYIEQANTMMSRILAYI